MTNRRQFLQIGVSATALPLLARVAHAGGLESAPQSMPLLGVVYDTRFAESVAFAERSASLGVPVHAIDGDMTRLWFDQIHRRWQQRPAALAGLTAPGPMFCFAELARDVRMRVVFRAEHRAVTRGAPGHAFTGPVPMLSEALGACAHPGSFGAAMAGVVARCPNGRSEIASAEIPGRLAPADEDDTLYTWLIAPAVRV